MKVFRAFENNSVTTDGAIIDEKHLFNDISVIIDQNTSFSRPDK
jgi:hypothetical protein